MDRVGLLELLPLLVIVVAFSTIKPLAYSSLSSIWCLATQLIADAKEAHKRMPGTSSTSLGLLLMLAHRIHPELMLLFQFALQSVLAAMALCILQLVAQ